MANHNGPLLVVIAGHNGAGKSTCYAEYLRDALDPYLGYHIDPDAIEREIRACRFCPSPSDADFARWAAMEANRRRLQYVEDRVSFSMETVLSDPVGDKLRFMEDAIDHGYYVVLLAVGLDSPAKSQARVQRRVTQGGHNVDPQKIFDRYPRVLNNVEKAVDIVSAALVIDNSEDVLDGGGAYFAFAHFIDGKLIKKASQIPSWWTKL